MAFLASFLQYFIKFVVFVILAVAGVFAGKKWRMVLLSCHCKCRSGKYSKCYGGCQNSDGDGTGQPDVSETLSAAAVSGTVVSEYEYRIRLSETGRRYGKLVLPVPVHEYALSGLLLYALLVFC